MKNIVRSMDCKTTLSGRYPALNRREALTAGGRVVAGGAAVLAGLAATRAQAETHGAPSNVVLGEMVVGAADAPVTIIEYASMTCPHCARFHVNTYPDLKRLYIDTGKVRLIYRDFPLDGSALRASMLTRCGGENRREGFLTVLFQQQRQWTNVTSLAELDENLGRIAKLGGISTEAYQACMANSAIEDAVLKDRLTGEKVHKVSSTPTFIINGDKHEGALTIEMMNDILKPMLSGS